MNTSIPGIEVTEKPMTSSVARQFARDPGPGNPSVGANGSAEAQAFRQNGYGIKPQAAVHPKISAPSGNFGLPASNRLASMPGAPATSPVPMPSITTPQSVAGKAMSSVRSAASTAQNFLTSPGMTTQPIGQAMGSAAGGLKSVAGTAAKILRSPVAVGAAAGLGALKGFETSTDQYAKRFGLEHTEPGLLRDTGIRTLGVASDVGDALTLGFASRLFRDNDGSQGSALTAPANAVGNVLTPHPRISTLAQMDPTSVSRQDPANPLNPVASPASTSLGIIKAMRQPNGVMSFSGENISGTPQYQGGFKPSGSVSAQNMAAADQLAARSGALRAGLLGQEARKPQFINAYKAETDRNFRIGQLANDATRTAMDGVRAKSEADARGMEMGAAKQLQTLRDAYIGAKTPAEQTAAAQKLSALQGKIQQDEYMAVSSGQSVDAMGNVIRNPDQIVNKRTGQPVASNATLPKIGAINAGKVYLGGDPNASDAWKDLVVGRIYEGPSSTGEMRRAKYLGHGEWERVS